MEKLKYKHYKVLLRKLPYIFLFFLAFSFRASAFELLSEGAMDSVSASTGGSTEEFLSIAGPTAAGLRIDGDYEELPFDVSAEVGVLQTDEVEGDLNFALTQEVEVWAESLRKSGRAGFQVEVLDRVFDVPYQDIIQGPGKVAFSRGEIGTDGNLTYELGKVKLFKDSFMSGVDQMTGTLERYMESAAFIDNRSGERLSLGNAYISDVTSRTNIVYQGRVFD